MTALLQPLEKVVPNRIPHWNRFIGSPFMAGYFRRPFLLVQLFSRSYEKLIQNVTIYAVNIYILYIVYHIGTALLGSPFMAGYFRLPNFVSIYCIQK